MMQLPLSVLRRNATERWTYTNTPWVVAPAVCKVSGKPHVVSRNAKPKPTTA